MKNFLDYIQGKRRGKKAHDLEREAMQDSFLQDSLDGYDSVEGKHVENISRLQERIALKTQKKKSYSVYWYAAASILIFVSAGIYILMQNREGRNSQEIAYHKETKEEQASTDSTLSLQEKEKSNAWENIPVPPRLEIPKIKERATPLVKSDSTASKEPLENYWVYEDHTADKRKKEEASVASAPAATIGNINGGNYDRSADENDYTDNYKVQSEQWYRTADTVKETERIAINSKDIRKKKKSEVARDAVISTHDNEVVLKSRAIVTSVPIIGLDAYNKYLKNAVALSKNKECEQVKGTVIIGFTVDSSGKPQNIKVTQSLCKTLDDQLIELIKKGSDWTEGQGQIQFIQ